MPPNVHFFVDDLEDEWTFDTNFDFIFSRFMTGSIRDFPRYFKQCYEYVSLYYPGFPWLTSRPHSSLAPGGTLELIDIIYPLASDDGSLKPEHAAQRWSILLQEGFAGNERPLNTALKYKEQLAAVGFVDVVEVKEKWPINGWAKDKKYKHVGMFCVPMGVAGT